ncbi:DUF72 domain-containing protein [Nocardia sp. CDC159]|uniref:DUF72 domain-containing protein n=1 Tax=Nocardia pulmonis TaxID=2951408 RepID=A0A9X2EH31_9NOCA|nr:MULTISPECIES: DUF72 domain-containing protein [Nocardia]MCM6778093.1 DUF72 domain-containing protein [Nocardia pulmonis]MCM6790982.1 DUF72 domain-containing protein [Nocardia sp. CDC159]
MRLYVGCAQWTHPAWQDKQPEARARLRGYARWCNAVEGNTTFYATPARRTVAGWAEQTDADFRFVVKLPKTITHERRLRETDAELHAFLDAMEPLGARAHALWIQLPASFAPTDLGALARFLRQAPQRHRYAVEVRHPAFFDDERAARQLEYVLGRTGAEWMPFDTTTLFASRPTSATERDAWARKPRVALRTRALTDAPIVRYIGRDDAETTIAGWRRWVDRCVDWLGEGRSPTVFIHTPDNAESLVLARRFHAEVRARVPELEPLPEPVASEPMTLF